MTPTRKDGDVNIVYREDGFRARTGHWVRTSEEAIVCSWLEKREVSHHHAGEVFDLTAGSDVPPRVYIPSIILTGKRRKGKTVIIEPLDGFGLTPGNMKLLTDFREKHKKTHYVVALANRQSLRKIPKRARDIVIALEDIKSLEQAIPLDEP